MNWLNPPHTLGSVVEELAEGLRNGTVALLEEHQKASAKEEEVVPQAIPSDWAVHRDQGELVRLYSGSHQAQLDRAQDFEAPRQSATSEQATIGKDLNIRGEISGSESLYIDGKVEGSVNLPGNRVTVGFNGQVAANASARGVIVFGKVRGNVTASNRVDIRREGSLTGDVTAQRISIEDGAFFKGGIDLRNPGLGKFDAKPKRHISAPVLAEATKIN